MMNAVGLTRFQATGCRAATRRLFSRARYFGFSRCKQDGERATPAITANVASRDIGRLTAGHARDCALGGI